MSYSLKQLFRTPLKLLLFLLIVAASTALLIFGTNLWLDTARQLQAMEESFTTIGTVRQRESSMRVFSVWDAASKTYTHNSTPVYDSIIPVEALEAEGLHYLKGPEKRPYYGALMEGYQTSKDEANALGNGSFFVAEFTPIETCVPSRPVRVNIIRVLSGDAHGSPGFWFCDHYNDNPKTLEAGKTYIAWVWGTDNPHSGARSGTTLECRPVFYPGSTQRRKDWTLMESSLNEDENLLTRNYWEEVTDGFYETGRGRYWLNYMAAIQMRQKTIPVLPADSLTLLPAFHRDEAAIKRGRGISDEEFEQGAAVCLVTEEFATLNGLQVGDTLTLPLVFADYSSAPSYSYGYSHTTAEFSLLNAQGELYPVFWEGTYEIVGTYRFSGEKTFLSHISEMGEDMVIIPARSVRGSDEHNIVDYGPMRTGTTSFQIPNGTIGEFDAVFRTLPVSEFLEITYDDKGYEQISGDLKNARQVAMLLCGVGLLATLAALVFLLYFFVVKQKKRTAVERSLGMSKGQCRVSMLTGVLALTLAGVILGSGGSMAAADYAARRDSQAVTEYSLRYSNWKQAKPEAPSAAPQTDGGIPLPNLIIPAGLLLFVSGLSLVLVNRNLAVEPIQLLSVREE